MKREKVNPLITQKHTECLREGFRLWGALEYGKMPALGDYRWTSDLILSTWHAAETGETPVNGLEYRTGKSGGGFDSLDFQFLPLEKQLPKTFSPDLSISLNQRKEGQKISIPIPFYGAGMSYGSISANIMIARAKLAKKWNTFTSTGEGGYPDVLIPYKDHVITQIATGYFGVREETIQYARIVEFKYAQGAKPGLGGHLLADKATVDVAKMRGSLPGISLFSPFPFIASTQLRIIKNMSIGSKQLIPKRSSLSKCQHPSMWTWWQWEATLQTPIFCKSMGDMVGRVQLLRSPKKILPCRLNLLSPKCIGV